MKARGLGVSLACLAWLAAGSAPAQPPNPVEPLSNGLLLTMTAADVMARFGRPSSDNRSVGGGIAYPDFSMTFDQRGIEIWHATLKRPGVRLSSGIAVGSRRADVERTVGGSDHVVVGQYDLDFRYDSDGIVREIRISPSEGVFKPVGKSPSPGR